MRTSPFIILFSLSLAPMGLGAEPDWVRLAESDTLERRIRLDEIRKAEADLLQAGLGENPALGAEAGAQGGSTIGTSGRFGFTQALASPLRIQLAKKIAEKRIEIAKEKLREENLREAIGMRRAWTSLKLARESLAILQPRYAELQRLARAWIARPGESTRRRVENLGLQSVLSEFENQVTEWRNEEESAKTDLVLTLGEKVSDEIAALGLPALPGVPSESEDLWKQRSEARPAKRILALEREVAELEGRHATARQGAELTVGPFFSWSTGSETALGGGLSLELGLPLWNRAQGETRRFEIERGQVANRIELEERSHRMRLARLGTALEREILAAGRWRGAAFQAALFAADAADQEVASGRVDFNTYLTAKSSLLNVLRQRKEGARRCFDLQGELWSLVGGENLP